MRGNHSRAIGAAMAMMLASADVEFRDTARQALRAALPAWLAERHRLNRRICKSDLLSWLQWLHRGGWLAGDWPAQFGGAGWSPLRRYLLDEECALAHAPSVAGSGVMGVGPLLIRFGTGLQQGRWLPGILSGRDWWCEDFTGRPGETPEFRRDGDDYVVTAQRPAVMGVKQATLIAILLHGAGTDGDSDPAPTILMIDLASPGVTLETIPVLDGADDVAHLTLNAVRVPVENRIGLQGGGLTCAEFLALRGSLVLQAVARTVATLEDVRDQAGIMNQDQAPVIGNPIFAARLAEAEADVAALRTTALRLCTMATAVDDRRARVAMLAVMERQVTRRLAELRRLVFGPWTVAWPAQGGDNLPVPPGRPEAAAAMRGYVSSHLAALRGPDDGSLRDLIACSLLKD